LPDRVDPESVELRPAPAPEEFEAGLRWLVAFRRELDVPLLFLPESGEVAPGSLLLVPELVRSVVELAPVLPGV